MRYRPWIGFTLIGLSTVAEFFLGRSGLVFMATLFGVVYWATR